MYVFYGYLYNLAIKYENKYFPKKRPYITMDKELFSQVHCFDIQGES